MLVTEQAQRRDALPPKQGTAFRDRLLHMRAVAAGSAHTSTRGQRRAELAPRPISRIPRVDALEIATLASANDINRARDVQRIDASLRRINGVFGILGFCHRNPIGGHSLSLISKVAICITWDTDYGRWGLAPPCTPRPSAFCARCPINALRTLIQHAQYRSSSKSGSGARGIRAAAAIRLPVP